MKQFSLIKGIKENFGENEIHICCLSKGKDVASCIADTTDPKSNSFIKECIQINDVEMTSLSSIIYAIKKLQQLLVNNKEMVQNSKMIHLMINDSAYSTFINSSKYGDVVNKVLNGMLEADKSVQEICKLISIVKSKFDNLIIDPVSIGKLAGEETDLKEIIKQTWDQIPGIKAPENKPKERSRYCK